MYSTLIVGRMQPHDQEEVARLFGAFDETEMPGLMGTLRRELFTYQGLYFHLQNFSAPDGAENIAAARSHPLFQQVSDDLKPFISAYDPHTWRSPADAVATRFYRWSAPR